MAQPMYMGDVISIYGLEVTLLMKESAKTWIAIMDDNNLFRAQIEDANKLSPTYDYNEELLVHAKCFADRVDDDKLTRIEICKDMFDAMNDPQTKQWRSPDDVLWEWDLLSLSFRRNGVFFAMRIMTPRGRFI